MGQPLKASPLIEVLCEFRFAPSSAWDWTLPGRLYERIGQEFSERAQVNQFVLQVQEKSDNTEGSPQILNVPQRIQLKRNDETALVQIGPNILVINHLQPYPLWEKFSKLILRIFSEYIDVYADFTLAGIGLRYINQIPIPTAEFDIGKFITLKPNLTGAINRHFDSFHQRYDLYYESLQAVLIHQTSINEIQDGKFAIILDLDFDSQEVDNLTKNSDIEEWLDEAHQHLSEAFIASLNPEYYQQLKEGSLEL